MSALGDGCVNPEAWSSDERLSHCMGLTGWTFLTLLLEIEVSIQNVV
jgi:hypothetical protein